MAPANFDACMVPVFKEEGGFTMDRHDAGNWTGGKVGKGELKGTNFGIAASSHPTLDIRNLTKADAAKLYRPEYWNACRCDELSPGVDLVVMDIAVNSGVGRGRSYRDATAGIGDRQARVDALSDKRRAFYKGLKTFSRYGKVWLGRVSRIQAVATRMVLEAAGRPPIAVKAALEERAAGAAVKAARANKQATAAGATTSAAAAAPATVPQAPSVPAPDAAVLPLDLGLSPAVLLIGLAVVAGGIAVAILLHRARAHRAAAEAFAAAALAAEPPAAA
jgi:lysozyme family protein